MVAEYNIKSFGLYDKSALAAWHWSGGGDDDDADRRRCGGGGGASHVGIGAQTHTESVATLASTAARPARVLLALTESQPPPPAARAPAPSPHGNPLSRRRPPPPNQREKDAFTIIWCMVWCARVPARERSAAAADAATATLYTLPPRFFPPRSVCAPTSPFDRVELFARLVDVARQFYKGGFLLI